MIDNEKKEIAERLRDMVRSTGMIVAETRQEHPPMLSINPNDVLALADELDPPHPEPEAVVWWRYLKQPDRLLWRGWHPGMVSFDGTIMRADGQRPIVGVIEWKLARMEARP